MEAGYISSSHGHTRDHSGDLSDLSSVLPWQLVIEGFFVLLCGCTTGEAARETGGGQLASGGSEALPPYPFPSSSPSAGDDN